MTPAERLHAAADRIEELAKEATDGPWDAHPATTGLASDGPTLMRIDARDIPGRPIVADLGYDRQGGSDAAWIATMSPVIAGPLVKWLSSAATSAEAAELYDLDGDPIAFEDTVDSLALDLADAILST